MPKGNPGLPRRNTEARFAAFTNKRGPVVTGVRGRCWTWKSTVNPGGYGVMIVQGRKWMAHRWAYEFYVGPIPEGLTLDHLCRRPGCVRPSHLEPVTMNENTKRAPTQVTTINAAKTHCVHGHPFDGYNLIIRPDGKSRECRQCVYDRNREFKRRKRRDQLAVTEYVLIEPGTRRNT